MNKYIEQALKDLYNKEVDPRREPVPALYGGFLRTYNHAVDQSIDKKQQRTLARQFKNNNEVFSAFRAHRMSRDMAAQMVDKEGNLKSFDRFRKDVEPIADHHVRQWLRTEYDMALSRAHLASEWETYEADRDIMPNLRWVESTAITPDVVHSSFWGMVRPVDDAFWAAHHPGDHWGCQCSLEQTDDPVTPISDEVIRKAPPPSPGLEENPGKTKRLFSDHSSYFPGSCTTCPFRHLLTEPRTEKDCYRCKAANKINKITKNAVDQMRKNIARSVPETWKDVENTDGLVRISSKHGSNEAEENKEIATMLANRHGHKIDLIERAENGKSADAFNHTLGYKQEFKRSTSEKKNSISQSIREAADQANHIVLEIQSAVPADTVSAALQDRVSRKRNIESVWVIKGDFDKQYQRKEIIKKGFNVKWD